MKKYLFMLLALCLMPANNTAQILNSLKDIIRPTDPSLIRTLNGQWDFYFINGADWKEQACFYQPDYDISSWDRILVPGCWDALGYVEPKYANPEEINGLYRKNFTVPKGWKDKHVFLSFAKTVRAMRRAGYKDVKGKLYPGMRHEILNEIGREQVYHDIAVYMRKKGF